MDKNEVLNKISKIIPIIKRHIDLDLLVLFGSYAKGNPSEKSDIDIAVVSKDIPRGILNDTVVDALIGIRDVDLKFEPHFFRTEKWENPEYGSFIEYIKKYGEVIYSNGL